MIFLYIGIAFCVIVLVVMLHADWPYIGGQRTKGVVYDHLCSMSDGSDSYAPMVRFTGENGETIEITDGVYSGSPRPALCAEVELVYPAGAPQKARVRRPILRGGMYVVIAGMLVILILRALGWLPEGGGEMPADL